MEPIDTRVGVIITGDNRFFGRSVFEDWSNTFVAQTDAILAGFGVREITPVHRESLRLISLCTTSPDARVWPLKLSRLLASYGDPALGYFGGQLVSTGKVMGPGTVLHAARGLCWIAEQVGEASSDAELADALAAWKVRAGGRVAGFGVPFRAVDERRVALLRFARGTPIERLRHWRLHERVADLLPGVQPNVGLTVAAMFLDVGIAPDLCGLALSVCMSHVFLAHAVEAAEVDGARAHAIPAAMVEYVGAARRSTDQGKLG